MADAGVDDVLARLDSVIARAMADGDRRGYFAALYRKVTAKVQEGLEGGFFADPQRMERLDVLFADRYFEAIEADRGGAAPTDSWALTFAAGQRWRPLLLQHLLVGINAHINLDLGVAAARCAPGDELASLRGDYDLINGILAGMLATVQQDLVRVSPWIGLLDRIGARTQRELVRFSIVTARNGAWRFAERLAATPESGWAPLIAERDRRIADLGTRVLQPGAAMSAGLLLVRMRERSDVAGNIEVLLGAREPSLDAVAEVVSGSGP